MFADMLTKVAGFHFQGGDGGERLVVPDLYKMKMNCQTVRTFQHLSGHVLTRDVCQYLSRHIRSFQGLSAGFSACQGL